MTPPCRKKLLVLLHPLGWVVVEYLGDLPPRLLFLPPLIDDYETGVRLVRRLRVGHPNNPRYELAAIEPVRINAPRSRVK